MRKSFFFAGLAAIAAISFSSCSKNEVETPDSPKTFTHTVTIKAGAPETRTEIVMGETSASYKWSADDASRFVIKENNTSGSNVNLSLSSGNTIATLTAQFESATAEEYVYSASMANERTNSGQPKIPTSQTCSSSSYDPNADILIAKPMTFNTAQNELSMQFYRPVVINQMTLKGLKAGEVISNVTVKADKNITGYYDLAQNSWSGQSKEITITANQTVPENGPVTVWFITMPVEGATLTVTTTTENYIYDKTFTKTINFKEGEVTVFGVGMNESAKADYSGTYVLTDENGTQMAKAWESGENNIKAADVTIEEGVIYYDPDVVDISEAQLTIAKVVEGDYDGLYTIKQKGLYLYAASNSGNHLKAKEEPDVNAYWEITCTSGGSWSITAKESSNRNILRNNGSSKVFSCYASGQTPIALHPANAVKPTPVITGDNISIGSEAVSDDELAVTFNSNTSTITATTEATWLTVSTDGLTVNYSATANETALMRTADIVITASNTDGRTVQKTITVSQSSSADSPGKTPENAFDIAGVKAYIDANGTESVYVAGKVSRIVYQYDANHGTATFWISDDGSENNEFEGYSVKFLENNNWIEGNSYIAVGDDVILYGKVKKYNDIYETDSGSYLYSLNGSTEETVPTITADDITGIPAAGVTNQTVSVTFADNDGWTASVTCDGTIVTTASISGTTITYSVSENQGETRLGSIVVELKLGLRSITKDIKVSQVAADGQSTSWSLITALNNLNDGTYIIAAKNDNKYYAVPNTTISGQTFTCIESSYSETDGLTPSNGVGEFVFTSVSGIDNAYYIYNTSLKKYLVATGSKSFGYVDSTSSDYGYWTFSTVTSGGFSGVFSVKHSDKSHYIRAYNNSVRCYDGASNQGVYLFVKSN